MSKPRNVPTTPGDSVASKGCVGVFIQDASRRNVGVKPIYTCYGLTKNSTMSKEMERKLLDWEMEETDIFYNVHIGYSHTTKESEDKGKPPLGSVGFGVRFQMVQGKEGEKNQTRDRSHNQTQQRQGGTFGVPRPTQRPLSPSSSSSSSVLASPKPRHSSGTRGDQSRSLPPKGSVDELIEGFHVMREHPSVETSQKLCVLVKDRVSKDCSKLWGRMQEGTADYYEGFPDNFTNSSKKLKGAVVARLRDAKELLEETWRSAGK